MPASIENIVVRRRQWTDRLGNDSYSSAAAQDTATRRGACVYGGVLYATCLVEWRAACQGTCEDLCMSQLKATARALGDKTFFPPSTVATAAMLADNPKVTPEQKSVILDWGSAREKCFEREKHELQAINYPQQLSDINAAGASTAGINVIRLYRGEITWAEFNRVRDEYNAEDITAMSDVSLLLAQATPMRYSAQPIGSRTTNR